MQSVFTTTWTQIENELNRFHARVSESRPFCNRSARQKREWQEACRAFHACMARAYELATPEALQQIRAGAQPWRESALRFLEADPWFFRSGYMKGRIARALKHVAFTPAEVERVTAIVLAAVNGKDRQEFKEYCRLAKRVPNESLKAGLEKALKSNDRRTRSRAAQMSSYVEGFVRATGESND
jgi:hypothetical protein